jgi:hypothetical protein
MLLGNRTVPVNSRLTPSTSSFFQGPKNGFPTTVHESQECSIRGEYQVIGYSTIYLCIVLLLRREIFFLFKLVIAFPTSEVAVDLVPTLSYVLLGHACFAESKYISKSLLMIDFFPLMC